MKVRDQIKDFVQKNPGSNRHSLFDNFYPKTKRGVRKKALHPYSSALWSLINQKVITETDIVRNEAGTITDSKLWINENKEIPSIKEQFQNEISEKEHFQNEKDLSLKEKLALVSLLNSNNSSNSDIAKQLEFDPATALRAMNKLAEKGLVVRDSNKSWSITKAGTQIVMSMPKFQRLYDALPPDNFFYHIPMLLEKDKVGETVSADILAQRSNGYRGFYEGNGLGEREAREDFLRRIRVHLENEALKNTFIKENGFLVETIKDEDQLFLWRLYSLLHTVLLKSSEERRLGMAVYLYDPLLELMKSNWKRVENKLLGLSERDRYIVLLMLNGVQLETIVPKVEAEDFRKKLLVNEIPFKVHNKGTDQETTIIETIGK